MSYKFFPNSLLLLLNKLWGWIQFVIYLALFIYFAVSLYSFNPNDSSLFVISSDPISNYFNKYGSYLSSFLIYFFGSFSCLIPIFFLIGCFHKINKSNFEFIFLRLLIYLISIILIEQIFIFYNINLNLFGENYIWGIIGLRLYGLYQNLYFDLLLLALGLIGVFVSLNIFSFFKLKLSFKFFKLKKIKSHSTSKAKKFDPLVSKNFPTDINENIAETDKIMLSKYTKPSLDNLNNEKNKSTDKVDKDLLKDDAKFIEGVFKDFNITIEVINIKVGPVVTLYEVLPAPGIKINSIINLADDISRSMGATSVRIAQVFGTKFIGIEIPNKEREVVTIRELIASSEFKKTGGKIPICIGKDITGNTEVIDLTRTPHLLVAGTTGSGKSVFINSMLTSILYKFSPSELRLILIDPKMLELSVYNDIPHLLTPVVTEPRKSITALKWVCLEMERRYKVMNEVGSRTLENYNADAKDKMPFIVIVIDEMADLMMTAGKEVEHYVQRLAQMARACGIHLVMATQRPSVDIITGSIKANFPTRISFQVASKYDSRTILGEVGAEQLLGNGDMLMMKNGSSILRYQSAFMSDKEVQKMIKEIKSHQEVQYVEEIGNIINSDSENGINLKLSTEDEELITKSIDLIKSSGRASTSYLQRNFQIGYNKAARIMEVLEERGVVSSPNHSGKREVLINTN